ncbi:MAG: hypothetical protein QNJ75_13470 [Acidimicrobiia bacterium]|nr:hypothetical protein [Acidimicrobiia bacterium]
MNLDGALQLLRPLDLGRGDHAVFGSGPLLVRGIIPEVSDIDILARGPAWDRALSLGDLVLLPEHNVRVVALHGGLVTIGRSWAIGAIDVDSAIDTADVIREMPWVGLEFVADYKRVAGRPKDLTHLRLLAEYLDRNAD